MSITKSPRMYERFLEFLKQYGPLPENCKDELVARLRTKTVKKNDQLLTPGNVGDQLFFVNSGCLRLFYLANGVDITVWFSFENTSAIELSSFLSGTPSAYYLEAIEDSEVLTLPKQELTQLYQRFPEMEKIMRCFWEDVILHLLKRFTALQKDTAEKRYLDLMNEPVYLQRIPQKYLASYIGVTPTSLSRIRRNIR